MCGWRTGYLVTIRSVACLNPSRRWSWKALDAWMSALCLAVNGRVIAMDGKALRGTARARGGLRALHRVSAHAAGCGLTLGQRSCDEKSNEIMAIKELLPTLALEGSGVTLDAMSCQREIAAQIVEGGGDHVLAVKDNQPQLAGALRDFFSTLEAPDHPKREVSRHATLDKGHGRIETRRCIAAGNLDWLELVPGRPLWRGRQSHPPAQCRPELLLPAPHRIEPLAGRPIPFHQPAQKTQNRRVPSRLRRYRPSTTQNLMLQP